MTDRPGPSLRVIGPGRAGEALRLALTAAGWRSGPILGRGDEPAGAAKGVDLLVLAVPDASVASVAAAVEPAGAVVAHMAGSLGCDALLPHPSRGALHPLVAIPDPQAGAAALAGAWWGVAASSPTARAVVDRAVADLGGRPVEVADADRAAYHAAATIAANHLVALLAQVEAVATSVGAPVDAFVDLAAGALANVRRLGPADALTGPVARGDWSTVRAHRSALPPEELEAYDALSRRAAVLADRPWLGDAI